MNSAVLALLAFALWGLVLVTAVGLYRGALVLMKKRAPNKFAAGGTDEEGVVYRLNRAHLNVVENMAFFAVTVGAGVYAEKLAGAAVSPTFATLAWVVVGGRVLQTLAHLASGGNVAVNVRFTGFLIQLLAMAAMAVMVIGALT